MTGEIKSAVGKIALLVLSVGFLGVGMLKLTSYPSLVSSFNTWGLPSWSMYLVGLVEVAIAIALFYQPWRKPAMIGAAVLMVGAITVHLLAGEWSQLYGPLVVVLLLAALHFSDQ